MITSLEYTDNSLDENMIDLPSNDQFEKFSILNTTSLTTPPPESINSPDISYDDISDKLTNPNPIASSHKCKKRKMSNKKPKKDFFKLNQKFIYTHIKLRESLESSYKRLKTMNENYNKTQVVKDKCNCNQPPNETCTFCKLINLSPLDTKIPSDNNEFHLFDTLFDTSICNDLPDSQFLQNQASSYKFAMSNEQECKKETFKKLFCSDTEFNIDGISNLISEIERHDQKVLSPYFYSEGLMWEGISMSQVGINDLVDLDYLNENKPKKYTRKANEFISTKKTRCSLNQTIRRLSHLSDGTFEARRFRTRSARSASSSSTRSSNPSVNEVCSMQLNNDKFDINNIFIPNEIISCQKITPFQNHKITTPKWREYIIEPLDSIECEEHLNDEVFSNRHEIIELKEKLNLTNKKKVKRTEFIDSIEELKSILIKIDPRLVEDYDDNTSSSSKSMLEWPERKFPLSELEYQSMLRMDRIEFS